MDIIESLFAPIVDYFDLYRKFYNRYHCSCNSHYYKKKVKNIFSSDEYNEFYEKVIKSYFNIWYIKFFYLLQKDIRLNKNIHNIKVLTNKFINLYHNNHIDCNKKNKNKLYDLYSIILKCFHGNKYKNNVIFRFIT